MALDPAVAAMYLHWAAKIVNGMLARWQAFLRRRVRRQRRCCLMIAAHLRLQEGQRASLGHASGAGGSAQCEDMLRAWYSIRPRPRRWCARPRTETCWWEDEVLARWDDDRWLYHFRMTRSTLFEIADLLRPHLRRTHTAMRRFVSVEERVAITVWWLSSPLLYRKTATTFGLGISTVGEIAIQVCLAIEQILLPSTVRLGDYRVVMEGFLKMGFPQCVGAVDGTHIPVRAPLGRGDQLNILMQGTTDHTGRFIDLEFGYSRRHHDGEVFRQSALYEAMEAGTFVPGNPSTTINGVQVGPLLLADSAYPLSRWLMTPYGGHLDGQKMTYNRVFNRCKNVVECAFGRLKSRWRCLTAPLTVSEKNHVLVITACVVLHNICESKGHLLHPHLRPAESIPVVPEEDQQVQCDGRRKMEGEWVRSAIASMLAGQ